MKEQGLGRQTTALGKGRWLLLAAMVVLLPACSLKMMYNNADRFIRWQINDYVDLNPEQRTFLNTQISATLEWHRQNHLPLYSAYFLNLSAQVEDGLTPNKIRQLIDQFMVWGEEIEYQTMPVVIEFLTSMTDEQVAALPERLAEGNREFAEDELEGDLADHQAQWATDFTDVIARFTGRLSDDQKAYIERRATAYQPERLLWIAYRERWQEDLLVLLEAREEPGFADAFRQLVGDREKYYGPEFTRVSKENEALGIEMTAYVFSNLSERQTRRFSATLQEWGEDFAELAEQT
ncbi:MAG: DUF6279 family lipoprotein [Pseudomonadota bacterium]